jgi:hypothetical protein
VSGRAAIPAPAIIVVRVRLTVSDRIITVSGGEQSLSIWPSPVSDALWTLTRATNGLLQGAESGRAEWEDEPGQWRWLLDRRGDQLSIRVLHFTRSTREGDEKGTLAFDATCRLSRFAGELKSQLQAQLEEVGLEGYRQRWRRDFPTTEYNNLAAFIRRRRVGRSQGHP